MLKQTEKEIMKNWKGDIATPAVSICCITYNHEHYISEAIDSFLMQETTFPFEIVIGEDCSTDETRNVIKKYQRKHSGIISIITSEANLGVQNNFIRTLNTCQGEYIAICEGDDYWTDKNKLQIQKNFLDLNQEYVLTYHDAQPFDETGLLPSHDYAACNKDLSQNELLLTPGIHTLSTFFRNKIEQFPLEFSFVKFGDLFLWVLLGEFGKGKYIENIKPAMYRIHDGGIFSKKNKLDRMYMTLDTFYGIFAYFRRIKRVVLMRRYLKRAIFVAFKIMFFTILKSLKLSK